MNTRLRLLILSLVVGLVFLASAVGVMAQQATPTGEIELTGVLESISSGTITVSGQTINIIGAEIRNRLQLGSTVKVHVSEVGGVLTAREVETVSRDDDDDDGSNNNSNNTSNNNSNNTSNNNSNNTSNNNSNNTSNNNSNNTSNNNSNNNDDDDDDDNGGVRPTITAQQAIEDVLRVYPTTTIRSVELDTRFGGTLVWEVKIGNGTELVIDAQTGTILVIDRPGDDDDDDDDGGRNNNNSNNTSNNNSNNTSNNNSNNNSNDRGDDDDDDGGSNNNSNNNSNDDDDDGGGSGSDNDDNDD